MNVQLHGGSYVLQTPNTNINTIVTTHLTPSSKKAVAFDLDETLGSFADLYSTLWVNLKPEHHTQPVFNSLMRLYPEFLRVGILVVLSFLKGKIEKQQCLPIYIYTNNQCKFRGWVDMILSYLTSLVVGDKHPAITLFAKPILAYKIGNERVEPKRTTQEKCYDDFVTCSMLHQHTHELCFVDDRNHPHMKHRKVYFIQPPPYHHHLSIDCIVGRFVSSDVYKRLGGSACLAQGDTVFASTSATHKPWNPSAASSWLASQEAITQKIMYYLREFFLVSLVHTKKTVRRNRTRKRFMRISGRLSKKIERGNTLKKK
jgi:hypothetical protein